MSTGWPWRLFSLIGKPGPSTKALTYFKYSSTTDLGYRPRWALRRAETLAACRVLANLPNNAIRELGGPEQTTIFVECKNVLKGIRCVRICHELTRSAFVGTFVGT